MSARQVKLMAKRLLPVLLALAMVSAGCLGGGDLEQNGDDNGTGNDGTTPGDNGNGSTGNGGGEGGEGEVLEFTAVLTANVTSGQVPLPVNFTLEIEPEVNASLTWELQLGNTTESGNELPANVNHTYEEGGNHTVRFTVTIDGVSSEANLTIGVEGITVPEPNPVQSGSNSDCLDDLFLYLVSAVSSPDAVRVEVDPGTVWVGESDDGRVRVNFFRENDTNLGDAQTGTGVVPGDAAYGLVCIREHDSLAPAAGGTWTYQDGFPVEEE
jgi:hypothetical protein